MMVTETTATRTSVINPIETTVTDETTTIHTRNGARDTTARSGKDCTDYFNYMMLHRCTVSELKIWKFDEPVPFCYYNLCEVLYGHILRQHVTVK